MREYGVVSGSAPLETREQHAENPLILKATVPRIRSQLAANTVIANQLQGDTSHVGNLTALPTRLQGSLGV